MDSMDSKKEIDLLVDQLMISTASHVYRNIHNKKDKEAYAKAFKHAWYTIKETNLQTALNILLKKRIKDSKSFHPRMQLFSDVRKYYLMGLDHTIDILNSINKRFVVGGCDSDNIFIHTILENKDEYKSLL